MVPSEDDIMMQLPLTLDYKGGRAEGSKTKWILGIVLTVLAIIVTIVVLFSDRLVAWQRWLFVIAFDYIILIILRFFTFKELYYSDIYETLKETKNELPLSYLWDIFDIDWEYPYIAYFRTGRKGIFVRMERDAITGKGESARYYHYEAISDAYNLAHSLKMDIRHIDYMDNVGNDNRLQKLYEQLKNVENPDMEDMMVAIYQHLEEEMSRNYASFDIYLYLTRDKVSNFIYNVKQVSGEMCGGNFITYRILKRDDIRSVVMALFNLHDFSVSEACEGALETEEPTGIVPICVVHADGTEEKLNETREERAARLQYEQREMENHRKNRKSIVKRSKKKESEETFFDDSNLDADDDLDIFN